MSDLSQPSDPPDWQTVLERLHGSSIQIAMVVSGGGSGALAECFSRAGASTNFVEAVIPYSRKAMTDYLGTQPIGPSASEQTARQLARRAMERCVCLTDSTEPGRRYAGVALVAALPTITVRESGDRIHVAACCDEAPDGAPQIRTRSRELEQGQYTRQSAEEVADQMLLEALESLL